MYDHHLNAVAAILKIAFFLGLLWFVLKPEKKVRTVLLPFFLLITSCSPKTYVGGHLTDNQRIDILEARCENLEKNMKAYHDEMAKAWDAIQDVQLRRFLVQMEADETRLMADSMRRELDGIHMVLRRAIMNGVYTDVQLDSLIKALKQNPFNDARLAPNYEWHQMDPGIFRVDPGYDLGITIDTTQTLMGDTLIYTGGFSGGGSDSFYVKRKYPHKKGKK